ncbi:hypothetical protein PC2016_0625 [Pseudoalteromonas carrageenovora]|uniref:Uncharacterized protein n=1 Tax=Pseudoalteromonas carrageenovora IAM 12662 TaxID=1314868 RepID=A0A2K4X6H9_PSEVC|nr:hypothetical protein [Pseudoalteromonas carrageenovora]QBJ70868.1 hypothetical protein PC2016_0625 [Pseudoalteromonas carrageenovora]GEB69953.1 hypothetical protein PCA01_06630 [Pseudoalteromonas carrageenovora]SOU39935.1 protein of unknown function [Pseudoalteromonas carrageenovora IAM 12662]
MDKFTLWVIVFSLFLGGGVTWLLPKKWFKLTSRIMIVVGILGVFFTDFEILSAFCFSCIPIGFGLLTYNKKYLES